jgi:TolB-like protein
MPGIFEELRRRNVFRVGIAYAVAAWVLLQLTDVVAPILVLPDWVPRLVLMLIGIGFLPALILAWAFELTPEGIKREKDVDRSRSIPHSTGRRLDFVIIAVLSIGIVLLLIDKFSPPAAGTAGGSGTPSIAVLPFANLSSDPEQAFFSDGITEEVLNALASVRDLRVAGRTSSFAFKGQGDDLRRIGDTLGVDHIIEGSVQRSGDTVRVTARLVQVADGFQVWSDTYERRLTDIFEIQDDIALSILRALTTTLLPGAPATAESDRTSPAAYERFLRARQRMYERSKASLEDARRLFDEVIDLDPGYAPAYAERGIAAMLLADDSYGDIPPEEAQQQGRRFLDLALELDPESAEALAGLGLYFINEGGRADEAVAVLERSLDLNPNQLEASLWLATALELQGDIQRNLEVLEELTERDPLFRPAFSNAVFAFNVHGMPAKAEALIERVRRFDPNDQALIQAEAVHAYFAGDMVEGLRKAEQALALAPNAYIALSYYAGGLRQTHQLRRLAELTQVHLAVPALDALGRRDEALQIAYEMAARGEPAELLNLYKRANRNADIVAYIDERWPNLDAFEREYAPDAFGYGLMLSVAYAYSQTGDDEKFDDAIARYRRAIEPIRAQGIDHRFLTFETAMYHAVTGDYDAALDALETIAGEGTFAMLPIAVSVPEFRPLVGNPRFVAVEKRMLDVVNAQREELGLDPVDPANDFWQYETR